MIQTKKLNKKENQLIINSSMYYSTVHKFLIYCQVNKNL